MFDGTSEFPKIRNRFAGYVKSATLKLIVGSRCKRLKTNRRLDSDNGCCECGFPSRELKYKIRTYFEKVRSGDHMENENKPRTNFCWHCARQLRGNHFAEYETGNGKVVVHKACLGILEGSFNHVRAIDDIEVSETL